MQVQDVEQYVALLDQALVDLGVQTTVPVILLGGAYILITLNARRMTQDIDIFVLIGGETDHATGLPLAVAFYQAAHVVAQHQHLHPHWLNTIRAAALQPPGIPTRHILWKHYTLLCGNTVFLDKCKVVNTLAVEPDVLEGRVFGLVKSDVH